MTKKFVSAALWFSIACLMQLCLYAGDAQAVDVCLGGGTTCLDGETLTPSSFGQSYTKFYDIILTNHATANDIAGAKLEYNFNPDVVTCAATCKAGASDASLDCLRNGVVTLPADFDDFGKESECDSSTGRLVIAGFIDVFNNVDFKTAPVKIATIKLTVTAKYDYDVAAALSQNNDFTYVSTKTNGSPLPSHSPFLIHLVSSDTTAPSCTVTPLSTTEGGYGASTFPVSYSCTDNLDNLDNADKSDDFTVSHADLYFLEKDSLGNIKTDWKVYQSVDGLPGSLTFPQKVDFTGSGGNTYCFKAVSYDSSGNLSPFPSGNGSGEVCAKVAKYAILAAQKPVNSSQLGLVVLSVDSVVSAPLVTVTAGSCTASSVPMTPTVTKAFIGTYTFQSGCTGTTNVCVNTNEECISFSLAKLSASFPSSLSYGKASANFPRDSVNDELFVTLFEETSAAYPAELKPASPLYRSGPEGQLLLKEASVSFDLAQPLSDEEKEKTNIYVKEGGAWKMLATNFTEMLAEAKTSLLTTYGLFTDTAPPSISDVSITDNVLEAKIYDAGSGVRKDGLSLQVNSKSAAFTYDENTNMLKAVLDSVLIESGSALIEIQANDAVKNKAMYKESKTFTSAPFELQRVFAAPNPVRANDSISLMLDVDEPHGKLLATGMMTAKIELYSLAGKLVATIPGINSPSATKQKIGNAVRMKQKLEEGVEFPVLPNGVYIFRALVTDTQGKTLTKTGKLVIAR